MSRPAVQRREQQTVVGEASKGAEQVILIRKGMKEGW